MALILCPKRFYDVDLMGSVVHGGYLIFDNMHTKHYILILMSVLLVSCAKREVTETTSQPPTKLDGWIRYECVVYYGPSTDTKKLGYLKQPASVSVIDDGSNWLKISFTALLRDLETKSRINPSSIGDSLYIQKKNFTTKIPADW